MRPRNPPFPPEEAPALDEPERPAMQPWGAVLSSLELSPDSRVLELGCGTGTLTEVLAAELERLGGEGGVLALDIQPAMLQATRQRLAARGLAARVRTVEVPADRPNHLPVEAESFDRALLANVYLELQDPRAALLEVRRVLKAGALLLVLDWDPEGSRRAGPPPAGRPDPGIVRRDVELAGFVAVDEQPLSPGAFRVRGFRPGPAICRA